MKAKICILGEFAVGKSSLTRRLTQNEFDGEYKTTLGVSIHRHTLVLEGAEIGLIVWDLEGGEDSLDTIKPYLKGASGAVLVADVSRPETVEKLAIYRDLLTNEAHVTSVVVALNKSDLVSADQINLDEIAKNLTLSWPSKSKSPLVLTSAATGSNVDELFSILCTDLLT